MTTSDTTVVQLNDGDSEIQARSLSGLVVRRFLRHRMAVMKAPDCVTFMLGSKERYADYFKENPGTYWYTPGFIEQGDMPSREKYDETLKVYVEHYGEDNAQYLMETMESWYKNYSTAAYVDLGIGDSGKNLAYTRKCAESLGWRCDALEGDPGLLKKWLSGDWSSGAFLVVEPGQVIKATNDEEILGVE